MPLTMQQDFLSQASKKLVIGVAIDGSALSEKALKCACKLYNQKRGDALVILHVSAPEKTYLSKHLQPQYLRSAYIDKAATMKVTAEWACQDRAPGQSTCEALTELAASSGVQLLVVGSYGRKGEKLDMLGTVSDYSLRESHSSVYVARSTTPCVEDGHTYLFATDGSRAANLALCTLAHHFATPKDRVVVAFVESDFHTGAEECFTAYNQILDSKQIPHQCMTWKIDRQQTVADGVLDVAKLKGATCVVVGISGYGSKKVGSVSEALSVRCGVDTLVIKDPHEVLATVYQNAGAATLTGLITPSKQLAKNTKDLGTSRIGSDGIPAFRNLAIRPDSAATAPKRTPSQSHADNILEA